MPAAHENKPRPRGSGARLLRVRLLQEMEKAGLLSYVGLVEDAEPASYKASFGFRVVTAGAERVLIGRDVEAYVDGMLDALRVLGQLGEDLDKATREIRGE